jgi:hypothetical protein
MRAGRAPLFRVERPNPGLRFLDSGAFPRRAGRLGGMESADSACAGRSGTP